jgi:NADP-dependent 3-hydroxy acid dehydrogenase YdfG
MKQKTILITGASTGFGRATAELLNVAGHRVIASMRDIDGRNRAHADELRQQGIAVVELDVTDQSSVDTAIESVIDAYGRVDVLVNNAGIASAGVTEAFTSEQVSALLDVNVVGLLRVTRAVLPAMRRQNSGLIINIGSILGRVTFPFFGIYGASKFAVEALSDSLRYELSQLGIEVALVQPSAYPTPMYSNVQQPADSARAAEYGKVGEIPAAMFQHFMGVFQAPGAPDPREVGEAIAKLVEQPAGSRPARTVVGAAFGSDKVNAETAPVQSHVLESLGLSHLSKVA